MYIYKEVKNFPKNQKDLGMARRNPLSKMFRNKYNYPSSVPSHSKRNCRCTL